MSEELAINMGPRPYTEPGAVLPPWDEAELVAVLRGAGAEVYDDHDGGMFEPGDGSVFWPFDIVRDAAGRPVAVAGDHQQALPTPGTLRLFFDAFAELVELLGGQAWIYPGPRLLDAAEREWFVSASEADGAS